MFVIAVVLSSVCDWYKYCALAGITEVLPAVLPEVLKKHAWDFSNQIFT